MSATKTPLSEIISISDLPWQERQPGVRAKSLWADPATKRQAVLSRIEAGAKLPLHRHVGDELLFVVEGALSDDFGTVTAGNMGFRPNGCVHTVSTANGATVLNELRVAVESDLPEPASIAGAAASPGSVAAMEGWFPPPWSAFLALAVAARANLSLPTSAPASTRGLARAEPFRPAWPGSSSPASAASLARLQRVSP